MTANGGNVTKNFNEMLGIYFSFKELIVFLFCFSMFFTSFNSL